MAFYPILIELQGAPCLVAGGGALALHKAKLLLEQGAQVRVVAPEICPELAALPVQCVCRKAEPADTAGMLLVMDATGDAEAERVLSAACRAERIPYNCAGNGAACTAILPAVYRQGRVTLAVSSLGASPAASTYLRDRLSAEIPAEMDAILEEMERLRALAKARISAQPTRRRFLRSCLDAMLDKRAVLSPAQTEALLAQYEDAT
jgi:siroheme synthase-like protein